MLRGNEIDSPDVELLSAAGIGVLVVRPHAGGRGGPAGHPDRPRRKGNEY